MAINASRNSSAAGADGDWRRSARCRDDDAAVFFPPFGGERKSERRAREQQAKAICATCPVRADCLTAAVAADERHGVWGGLTADELRTYPATA